MNTSRIFALEFVICVGITSWGALKQGYAPWPPNIMASAAAMSVLSMTSVVDDKLSVLLASGFLLAILVGAAGGGSDSNDSVKGQAWARFAAVPGEQNWDVLQLGGKSNGNSGQSPSQ